uniref:CSON002260 protein n=1 Tax=Culicoides sonorensis TaxID=179676 RepID=A0A336M3X8_CULSO
MFLIQPADIVVDNTFYNNHKTKCTSIVSTMKQQEENSNCARKNGLNGNLSASATIVSQSTIAIEQVSISHQSLGSNTNHQVVPSSSGRNGDNHMSSSTSPSALITTTANNNNEPSHMNISNDNNQKKTPSVESSSKPNNNSRSKNTTITGERLQFFKDGKFILELARAREGDRTGWVSIPRKTYWPPTVSSSTSANFKKHESSTSLSCSDDNSSIQSSPWQRDHSWKKTIPRQNISKHMVMFFRRPVKFYQLTKESLKSTRRKCRRPHDTNEISISFAKEEKKNIVQSNFSPKPNIDENDKIHSTNTTDDIVKMQNDENKTVTQEKNVIEQIKSNNTIKHSFKNKHVNQLDAIVKKLLDRIDSKPLRIDQIRISHYQHVSPRKRILREFEKVSLEDLQTTKKRSRAKTCNTNSILDGHTNVDKNSLCGISRRSISPHLTANLRSCSNLSQKVINGTNKFHTVESNTVTSTGISSIPVLVTQQHKSVSSCSPISIVTTPTVSQSRISSYSITSLLGHESSSSSNNNQFRKNNNSKIVSYTDLALSPVSPLGTELQKPIISTPSSFKKKLSPSYGTPSPLNNNANSGSGLEYYSMKRSPDLSPSPEHKVHSNVLPRYCSPSAYNMMQASSSSPQSYTTGVTPTSSSIRRSPSPSNSDGFNLRYKNSFLSESPSHHLYTNLSPSQRYSPISGYHNRKSPHMHNKSLLESPTKVNKNNLRGTSFNASSSLSTSVEDGTHIMKEILPSPGVRNLPKKTAALRQYNNTSTSITSTNFKRDQDNEFRLRDHEQMKEFMKKRESDIHSHSMNVGIPLLDTLDRSQLNNISMHNSHASSSIYPYLFSSGPSQHNSFLNTSLSSYYQQVYAAAYRNPLWIHYPTALSGTPTSSNFSLSEHSNVSLQNSSWSITERELATKTSEEHLKGLLIRDGDIEDSNSDVPLNLSKH